MDLAALHEEVRAFCAAHGDPAVIAKYSRYFREGYDAYGVPDADMRAFREEYFTRHAAQLTAKSSLALGRLLMSSGKYEEAVMAILLARRVIEHLKEADVAEFELWLDRYVSNWAESDVMCNELLSPLLTRDVLDLERLEQWRQAGSRWRRRALAVSLIPLLKRGQSVPQLLELLQPMLNDGERVVQQGLGWCLRECWKKDPQPVEQLLLKHKDSAPRLIYQYACEKMDKTAKDRFRRARR